MDDEVILTNNNPVLNTETTQKELKKTFIEGLREDYQKALKVIDEDVGALIQNGKEAQGLTIFLKALNIIIDIRNMLVTFYTLFANNINVLERFKSERLKQLGYQLQPVCELLKESDASQEVIEQHVLNCLHSVGFNKSHWYIKEVIVTEIEYMLDTLQILVEPDFVPSQETSEEADKDRPDRYIPPDVKLEVWRRDQGKCVQCGSKEKLEYDHIIPVAKGGSNTARNVQLLCEKCNREKSARIA